MLGKFSCVPPGLYRDMEDGNGSADETGLEGSEADLTGRNQDKSEKDGWIPKHRFDEVNRVAKAFRELGMSPEEVRGLKSRLDELSKTNRFTAAERKTIAEQMFDVFPQLKSIVENADALMATVGRSKQSTEQYILSTEKRVDSYLTKLGLQVTRENNEDIQELLISRLRRDKAAMTRFLGGDATILDEVFKTLQRDLGGGRRAALAEVEGKKTTQTTKSVQKKADDRGDRKPASEHEVLADAHNRAWDRISAQAEG